MPELPEVETVKRALREKVLHKQIECAILSYENLITGNPKEFLDSICGQSINDITRVGKYLVFILDTVSFIVHLRMEGKFLTFDGAHTLQKHEHLAIFFTDGSTLVFSDFRKFGRIQMFEETKIQILRELSPLSKVGPEGISEVASDVVDKLHRSTKAIKTALLDQSIISGLGNIYANEVLFMSRVNPFIVSNQLTSNEMGRIIESTKVVLENAIEKGGTTIRSFESLGEAGHFQTNLLVHGRVNKPCSVCGETIQMAKINGRSSYYCPNCQKVNTLMLIGLTGKVGTGKSTVCRYLRDLGVTTFSADEIVKELYGDEQFTTQVSQLLSIPFSDTSVFKKEVSEMIFSDDLKREKLEKFIHPIVDRHLKALIKNTVQTIHKKHHLPMIVCEIPLILKSKIHYDEIWVMDSPKEEVYLRLAPRKMSRDVFDKIWDIQPSIDEIRNSRNDINVIVIESDSALKETIKKLVDKGENDG